MCCVSHEMGFARKVSDRVIFMDHGRIVEDYSKDDFLVSPKSALTEQENSYPKYWRIKPHTYRAEVFDLGRFPTCTFSVIGLPLRSRVTLASSPGLVWAMLFKRAATSFTV